jgi:stearoyl-CoA desaturase (Delta-9 desaturase)
MLLRKYSARFDQTDDQAEKWHDATWAFDGGLNNHSRAAKRRMVELRVARLQV